MVHTRNEKEVPQTTRDLSDPVVALVGEQIEDASGNLHKTKDIVKGKQYSTHSLLTSIIFLHVTSTCLLKILILYIHSSRQDHWPGMSILPLFLSPFVTLWHVLIQSSSTSPQYGVPPAGPSHLSSLSSIKIIMMV